MAASSGRKTTSSNKKTTFSTVKGAGKSKTSAQKKKAEAQQREQDSALFHEIGLIVLFAAMALLFCCNFGLIGPAGNTISGVLFGIFGLTAYVAPLLLFLAAAFWFANEGNPSALRKLIAGIILFIMLGVLCDLFMEREEAETGYHALQIYEACRDKKAGGGILAGSIGFLLRNYLGVIGTVLVVLVCSVVCLILLTEKSLIDSLKQGGDRVRELSREDMERRRESAERRREDAERRREQNRMKRQEQEEERVRREEARRLREEEIENEKILRMEKRVSGVMLDATLPKPEKMLPQDDMHEIILSEEIVEESLQQSRVEIIEEPIIEEQTTDKQKNDKPIVEKQISDRQVIEKQMVEEPQAVKAERNSGADRESSSAFEQWDMPDLPIRIHKEGVEETDISTGQGTVTPKEADLYGQETMPDSSLYGQETMPTDSGLYGQGAAMPTDSGLYGQEAATEADSGSYEQMSPRSEDIGAYEQDFMKPEDTGSYEQNFVKPEDTGSYEQNFMIPEEMEAYEQNARMQEGTSSCEQSAVGRYDTEPTEPYEQSMMGQEDAGAFEQDLFMSDMMENNFSQTSDTVNSAAGATVMQNSPMLASDDSSTREGTGSTAGTVSAVGVPRPAVGAVSTVGDTSAVKAPRPAVEAVSTTGTTPAGGVTRPTVAIKPAVGAASAAAGMPALGGIQSMTVNGKEAKAPKQYMFPPITLLQKGVTITGDSVRELKETAVHLQQTLSTFGVKVTITDISQGPSVTRYELQPEQGVKVSKIVSLTDDIKLNLAAMDIRIEAPIPGKAAIGIEVPNKESIPVALRDLLETEEFRNFPSNLAFAVGKDIAGKVVVADIAKMPHMLIAGATGSGKSVCINTLIMGILYKAHPDDVKLIMVDPKVVELSVYNGIPHLLIPVVTDPKKASAALHWGVAEMEDRYRKFAEWNVRDLKGYNKKVEAQQEKGDPNAPKKLPQIVIIVDELADLMMVCPGEVEESICRLAQLARAAGIHLIIATQRPSVDVITGLIKANMPSRVAFSVSSGVDSRTILDMVGAEKLLGKGDMLFYPQGYAKPARVQGAFVSDNEVSDVVDFMKNQTLGNTYATDIEEKIKNMGSSSGGASGSSEVDDLFEKAGRLIIDKDKASIGMLQRALQIGFNRAARIMDQLCSYGVVGEEEGTKPRKILMSPEQFEQLLEEV